MPPIYLGVDVAGQDNTWVCAVASEKKGLRVMLDPKRATLAEIVAYCEQEDKDVVAVCIDAPLTIALSEESGFRTCDRELKSLLPQKCRKWVMSSSALMAVVVRGQLLADNLSPVVGTLIETHPRASLLFGLGDNALTALQQYKTDKKGDVARTALDKLWDEWCKKFDVRSAGAPSSDGALDSLICATVAYQFHHAPHRLRRLRHNVPAKTGHGPFYVFQPSTWPSGLR